MKKSAVIAGIGETKVGKHPGSTTLSLQAEAVRLALRDAQVEKGELDALYTIGSYIRPIIMHGLSLTEYLGITPRFEANFDVGGTVGFIAMIIDAMAAIEDGRIETAVCVYGDNAATHRPSGTHGFVPQVESGTEDFEDPFGSSIVASYALVARRYLDLYGLEPEATFWPVAKSARDYAMLNDNAAYRKPITIEDYRASPWMAEPFRRLDCSPVVDGAGAFVIMSKLAADKRKLPFPLVSFLGGDTQATHKIVMQMPDVPQLGMAEAGRRAFAQAGLTHKDCDFLTLHDGFTSSVVITIEGLGFCPPGEGGRFAAAGEIRLDGTLPTNPHGGLLSQGHVGGVLHVVEAVRQLRGDAGARQVKDAEIAAVAGNGNIFSICGLMLLGKGA